MKLHRIRFKYYARVEAERLAQAEHVRWLMVQYGCYLERMDKIARHGRDFMARYE